MQSINSIFFGTIKIKLIPNIFPILVIGNNFYLSSDRDFKRKIYNFKLFSRELLIQKYFKYIKLMEFVVNDFDKFLTLYYLIICIIFKYYVFYFN